MQIINEVKKEDDHYFAGAFWVVADSVTGILSCNDIEQGSHYDFILD